MNQNQKNRDTLAKTITDMIGEAIADIRGKVVEKPWFGEEVTGKGQVQEVQVQQQDTTQISLYAEYGMPGSFEQYRDMKDGNEPEQAEKQKEIEYEREK